MIEDAQGIGEGDQYKTELTGLCQGQGKKNMPSVA